MSKIKLEITTDPKNVELTNMILARSTEELEVNSVARDHLNITLQDVERIKDFRKSLLESFLNPKIKSRK